MMSNPAGWRDAAACIVAVAAMGLVAPVVVVRLDTLPWTAAAVGWLVAAFLSMLLARAAVMLAAAACVTLAAWWRQPRRRRRKPRRYCDAGGTLAQR